MASEDYLGIETMLIIFLMIVFVFASVYLEHWNVSVNLDKLYTSDWSDYTNGHIFWLDNMVFS